MDSAIDWIYQLLIGAGLIFILGTGLIFMLLLQKQKNKHPDDDHR
ncbi:hypothetical protein [Jeotgalibacillus sp. R-1-5s-1]|nr:hypothetical protein [Jeotgalibacillus sp. R-1-5s-1]